MSQERDWAAAGGPVFTGPSARAQRRKEGSCVWPGVTPGGAPLRVNCRRAFGGSQRARFSIQEGN